MGLFTIYNFGRSVAMRATLALAEPGPPPSRDEVHKWPR